MHQSLTFLTVLFTACVLFFVPSAVADDLMNLFPKQREAHQDKMDKNAQKYEARGNAYVDHLYATGGEGEMLADDDLFLTEGDLEKINVDEVSDIVKANSKSTSE